MWKLENREKFACGPGREGLEKISNIALLLFFRCISNVAQSANV